MAKSVNSNIEISSFDFSDSVILQYTFQTILRFKKTVIAMLTVV